MVKYVLLLWLPIIGSFEDFSLFGIEFVAVTFDVVSGLCLYFLIIDVTLAIGWPCF